MQALPGLSRLLKSMMAPTLNFPESAWDTDTFSILRGKWSEVPAGDVRLRTTDLLALPDDELLSRWQSIRKVATTGDNFAARGWYHSIYRDLLRDKRVMDVGCGLAIDGISFAESGARVTFVDIVESNLEVVKRICGLLDIRSADFLYLGDFGALRALPAHYDAVWCQGSMINAPFHVMQRESAALLEHLPVGGRWIELAYPKARWEREGRLPFHRWGEKTDGPGTPWMEWYDLGKLLARLAPAEFEVVLHFNFHDDDFNWFDLKRTA